MTDSADIAPETEAHPRALAAWAARHGAVPRFVLRRASGTFLRVQPGGLANLALILCGVSVAGLVGIAFMINQ